MDCSKVKILLSAYVDHAIDPAEKAKVEIHLEGCGDCRRSLEELEWYIQLAASVPSPQVPSNLKQRVMLSVRDESVIKKTAKVRMLPARKGWITLSAAAAAITVLAFWLLVPNRFNTTLITSDVSYRVIKTGKGPSMRMGDPDSEAGEMRSILSIADQTGARVIRNGFNTRTGMTDFLTVRIKKGSYERFAAGMIEAGIEAGIPAKPEGMDRYVAVQLYFPGRKFFAGDLDGDGYDDVGIYFSRGKLAGRWFVSLNDQDSNYLDAIRMPFGDTLSFLPLNAVPIAGDMNGDGFDDLVIFRPDEDGLWKILLNDRNGGMMAGYEAVTGPWPGMADGMVVPITGDINGDGLCDLVIHYRRGELAGQWFAALNQDGRSFGKTVQYSVSYPAFEEGQKYTPLLIDFNGDGYDDVCLYWQAGELIARWFIGINAGEGAFAEPFQVMFGNSPRAYLGDYETIRADLNADGLDDLLVKVGTWDETGPWYADYNQAGIKFTYGYPVSFDGKNDIQVSDSGF